MTQLPTDDNGHAMQALAFNDDKAHKLDFTATSAHTTADFDAKTKILLLTATADCYVRLGESGVTATTSHHFLTSGTPWPIAKDNAKRIAAIRSQADGTLHISELK